MVSVRPVTPSSFEQLYPLLHWHDPALDKAMWQRIFDYSWTHDNPYCGYALFEDSKSGESEAVGFIGFIFSDRPHPHSPNRSTTNRSTKICNLTTWVVKPQYRGHSLSLMMPVVRMKEHTVTDLSAGDDVIKLSKRLGFKILDDAVKILLPQGVSSSAIAGQPTKSAATSAIFMNEAIAPLLLPPTERTLFNDHRPYPNCHQLVLKVKDQICHVVYTLNRDTELSYAHIQYINNPALFEQHQMAIRQRIIRQSGLPLIAIDSRLVASLTLPFSYHLPLSSARIYRPSPSQPSLRPEQIDNLYSELALLDFSTADSLALGWREKALSICSPAIKKLSKCR